MSAQSRRHRCVLFKNAGGQSQRLNVGKLSEVTLVQKIERAYSTLMGRHTVSKRIRAIPGRELRIWIRRRLRAPVIREHRAPPS